MAVVRGIVCGPGGGLHSVVVVDADEVRGHVDVVLVLVEDADVEARVVVDADGVAAPRVVDCVQAASGDAGVDGIVDDELGSVAAVLCVHAAADPVCGVSVVGDRRNDGAVLGCARTAVLEPLWVAVEPESVGFAVSVALAPAPPGIEAGVGADAGVGPIWIILAHESSPLAVPVRLQGLAQKRLCRLCLQRLR